MMSIECNRIMYRVVTHAEWKLFQHRLQYNGNKLDRASGYIHLSPKAELLETIRKHYIGRTDVIILTIDLHHPTIKNHVKWDYVPSRERYFPHIYTSIPIDAVVTHELLGNTTFDKLM